MIVAKEEDRIERFDSKKVSFTDPISNERFIKSDYNGIDAIIDDATGYINASRVLHKYGKRPREFLRQIENLRSLLVYAKHKGVFDVFLIYNKDWVAPNKIEQGGGVSPPPYPEGHSLGDSSIYKDPFLIEKREQIIQTYNDRTYKLKETEIMEIYEHLPFIDTSKRNKGYTNETKGLYIHPLLIHPFAYYADIEYELLISDIADQLNKEHHLRIISLNQKISEYKDYISKLENDITRYNEFTTRGKGSIILKRNKISDDSYNIVFNDVDVSDFPEYKDDIVIGDLYNIHDLERILKFYTRGDELEYVRYSTGSHFKITDIEKFKALIEDLRKFKFQIQYNPDKYLEEYLSKSIPTNRGFKGRLFEFFCWKKFKYPILKYERTELLALTKQDKGIDLLDTQHEIIAQCKWYDQQSLNFDKLHNFINFCRDERFKNWKKILFMNEDIKLCTDFPHDGLFEVHFIERSEFEAFYNNALTKLKPKQTTIKKDRELKPPSQLIIKLDPELHSRITEDILNELTKVDEYPMNDMIKYINNKYKDELPMFLNEHLFISQFAGTYQRTLDQKHIPTDAAGHKILRKFVSYDEECEWIQKTIGYGEFVIPVIIKMHNTTFNTNYTQRQYTARFGSLFERRKNMRGYKQRRFGDRIFSVISIYKQDRLEVYKEFLSKNDNLEAFNIHFHRYETPTSFAHICSKIGL